MVILGIEKNGEFGQNIQKSLWNHELQQPQCFTDVIFRCVDGELPAHYFILKEVCVFEIQFILSVSKNTNLPLCINSQLQHVL